MARSFNGTSDWISAPCNLAGDRDITCSMWLWWDSFTDNDDLCLEHTADTNSFPGFYANPNASTAGGGIFTLTFANITGLHIESFARPSAATWHHYLFIWSRPATCLAYVDGVSQSMTVQQDTGNDVDFSNDTLYFMNRGGTTLFGAGRQAEVAIWRDVILGQGEASMLAGGTPASFVRGENLALYCPLWGDSPEVDLSGQKQNATIDSGTTIIAHPPVGPLLFELLETMQAVAAGISTPADDVPRLIHGRGASW